MDKDKINNVTVETIEGISYQKTIDGEIFLNLKDVAIGLGFERIQNIKRKEYRSIRWENIKGYLTEIDEKYLHQEVGENLFISESDFYELAMLAKSEVAKAFRKKIAKEILPAIRKHGAYISDNATPEQLDHLMENQVIEFYTGGGERSAQRIRQLIFDKKFDTLDLIKSFNYIYDRLSSNYRKPFINSFKYALDEAYDRVLTGGDKKMKKIAMENLRTKGELLYRIENQHHQRDNRSYGQRLRYATKRINNNE